VVTATSVVLVVVVIATAARVFWPRLAGSAGLTRTAAVEPAYRAGQAIDTPEAWHRDSPYTLVVFAQASCGACITAKPYLRSLVSHLDGRASIVMATPGRAQAYDEQYGADVGLPSGQMRVVPAGTRVTATPTLVLVNQSGEILGAWQGVGPPEEHAALTAEIDGLLAG
jgi:hypothetical protein